MGTMTFSLKRWFSRSIVDGPDLAEPSVQTSARTARRKRMLALLAGVLALFGVGSGIYYLAIRPVTLRIAVGPQNGDDSKVIQALAQAFGRERGSVRLRPVFTEGPPASAEAITSGTADLAVIRGDLGVPKNASAVAILHKNTAVLWVPGGKRPGLRITKIAQLAGRRVGVVGRTESNVRLLKAILMQYAVDPAKVEMIQLTPAEIADAVKDRKVDAFVAVGPLNGKAVMEAVTASVRDSAEPKFLAIDSADAIVANHPIYESVAIPAGSFGGAPLRPDSEIKSIGLSYLIVARPGLSDGTVSALTRQLFAARQNVIPQVPQAAQIETPDTDKDAVTPAHPGAAAYVDGEEKSFLDRYSDFIWFSLIGISALGSAGAWLASYLREDERINNVTQRDRLLDMIRAARRCDKIDELDTMQAEADDILRDTLNCFEHGLIEEAALTAFNIALEQFHNAVADRKTLLAIPNAPVRNQRPQAV